MKSSTACNLKGFATSFLVACVGLLSGCGGGGGGGAVTSIPDPLAIDSLAPTVSIASSASGAITRSGVTFTFTFSEDVGNSFADADIAVVNGIKGALTKINGSKYTLFVTPVANSTGSINVSIPTGVFTDLANNINISPSSLSQPFDTASPVVVISGASGSVTTSEVTFTFDFSEDVGSTFTAEDVSISNGLKAVSVKKLSSNRYTLDVLMPSGEGNITVVIPAGSFSDLAGNINVGAVQISQAYNRSIRTTVVRATTAGAAAFDPSSERALPGNHPIGRYAAGAGEVLLQGGISIDRIQSAYAINKTQAAQWGFGIYIANGGDGWIINDKSRYGFSLGTNVECVNVCFATVRLVSKANSSCVADYRIKLISSDVATEYWVNLAAFVVKGCQNNTMEIFKTGKVAELHFRMLRDDMQYTSGSDGQGNFVNALSVGGNIYFE